MTETKRFTIKGSWSKSLNRLHGLILDNNEDMYVTDVVYLLNKFSEENEKLKEDKQALIEFIKIEFPKSHKTILKGVLE